MPVESLYADPVVAEIHEVRRRLLEASGGDVATVTDAIATAESGGGADTFVVADAAVAVRLEQTWSGRADGPRSQAWVERQMSKVHASLAAMNTGLADKPWCCNGNHLTLADVSVGCALSYLDFRFPHIGWRDSHAHLMRLSDKLFTRASFIESQPPRG
jgi:glutathione S-transferase